MLVAQTIEQILEVKGFQVQVSLTAHTLYLVLFTNGLNEKLVKTMMKLILVKRFIIDKNTLAAFLQYTLCVLNFTSCFLHNIP